MDQIVATDQLIAIADHHGDGSCLGASTPVPSSSPFTLRSEEPPPVSRRGFFNDCSSEELLEPGWHCGVDERLHHER